MVLLRKFKIICSLLNIAHMTKQAEVVIVSERSEERDVENRLEENRENRENMLMLLRMLPVHKIKLWTGLR